MEKIKAKVVLCHYTLNSTSTTVCLHQHICTTKLFNIVKTSYCGLLSQALVTQRETFWHMHHRYVQLARNVRTLSVLINIIDSMRPFNCATRATPRPDDPTIETADDVIERSV